MKAKEENAKEENPIRRKKYRPIEARII